MQIDNLSWFPGHMTKTKRMISAEIKNMDAVCGSSSTGRSRVKAWHS